MLDRRQDERNKPFSGGVAAASFLTRTIRRQANRIGFALRIMTADAPVSDLDERLRRSERKKRQLQRRIKQLLGEG